MYEFSARLTAGKNDRTLHKHRLWAVIIHSLREQVGHLKYLKESDLHAPKLEEGDS